MVNVYDTHAHLDYPDFVSDLPEVLQRAEEAGVSRIISIGTDLESSARAIALSEQHPMVFAAVGWHPSDAMKAPAHVPDQLRLMAKHPKVVAIGETGLDYYRLPTTSENAAARADGQERQIRLFREHLEVAAELGLNVVIHQREALDDVLEQLRPFVGQLRPVFHCFTEPVASIWRVLELDALVSFTGILTFKNAAAIRETLAAVPLDRMMLETDCPFLAPVPYRGRRCEPAYVADTARAMAEVKRCSLAELSQQTCANAHRFFPKLI